MEYTIETEIEKPLKEVINLYDNKANRQKWMPNFISYDLIKGEFGQVGTKAMYKFKINNKVFEIHETILERNNNEFVGEYASSGAKNIQHTKFIALTESTTKYITKESFSFKGMMKIIAFLMPGSFKKQTRLFVDSFKAFAEKN